MALLGISPSRLSSEMGMPDEHLKGRHPMNVRRIVPNIYFPDPSSARAFYSDILALIL